MVRQDYSGNKSYWIRVGQLVNGDPNSVLYEDKKDSPTLEEAREFIGGHIELVHTKAGAQLIIDEEGGFKPSLEVNPIASALYGGSIVGKAIILIGGAKWT